MECVDTTWLIAADTHGNDGTGALPPTPDRAALELVRDRPTFLLRQAGSLRLEEEDLVGDSAHLTVQSVGQPTGEVDAAALEHLVEPSKLEYHRLGLHELVGQGLDLGELVEA